MRGFLFEISRKKELVNDMDADRFIETRDGSAQAEWCENANVDAILVLYHDAFLQYKINCTKLPEENVHVFTLGSDTKELYFKTRFGKFQKKVAAMVLDEFANGKISEIQQLLEEDYKDAVYMPELGYSITFDAFIREAEPGVSYYIGNVIAMH